VAPSVRVRYVVFDVKGEKRGREIRKKKEEGRRSGSEQWLAASTFRLAFYWPYQTRGTREVRRKGEKKKGGSDTGHTMDFVAHVFTRSLRAGLGDGKRGRRGEKVFSGGKEGG